MNNNVSDADKEKIAFITVATQINDLTALLFHIDKNALIKTAEAFPQDKFIQYSLEFYNQMEEAFKEIKSNDQLEFKDLKDE